MIKAQDSFTQPGAERVAQRIREYWRRRDYVVSVWVEPQPFHMAMREAYWIIRSDLVNGWPRRKAKP